MEFKTALFYAFSAILIFAATRVITDRNPVHAALFLVLSFFSAAAIWMLLKAEFLAIVLVLVYVGAVMVLFLFVVMMLDINLDKMREGFWNYFPFAATIGVIDVSRWLEFADRFNAVELDTGLDLAGAQDVRSRVLVHLGARIVSALPLRPDHASWLEGIHSADFGLPGDRGRVDADIVEYLEVKRIAGQS